MKIKISDLDSSLKKTIDNIDKVLDNKLTPGVNFVVKTSDGLDTKTIRTKPFYKVSERRNIEYLKSLSGTDHSITKNNFSIDKSRSSYFPTQISELKIVEKLQTKENIIL